MGVGREINIHTHDTLVSVVYLRSSGRKLEHWGGDGKYEVFVPSPECLNKASK